MRRTLTILLVLGLTAGMLAAPAEAGKKKRKKVAAVRTFEVRYENPAIGAGGVGGLCSGCPGIVLGPEEQYVAIFIEDDVSPSGYIGLAYDADGDGVQDIGPTICGSTDGPMEVEGGTAYTAWPWAAGIDCPGSASVAGTIKVMASSSETALEKAIAKL